MLNVMYGVINLQKYFFLHSLSKLTLDFNSRIGSEWSEHKQNALVCVGFFLVVQYISILDYISFSVENTPNPSPTGKAVMISSGILFCCYFHH